MALRLYIVPLIGAGTDVDSYRPKYVDAAGKSYAAMTWLDLACLVAVDVDAAEHTQLTGQADVVAVPANLDGQIGGALATVQAQLESIFLPSEWVVATDTFRVVLRTVAGLFQFAQRLNGLTAQRMNQSGVTLDTRWNSLPQALRTAISDTAVDLGYDGTISGNPQLRTILRVLGSQWGVTPFQLGPVAVS